MIFFEIKTPLSFFANQFLVATTTSSAIREIQAEPSLTVLYSISNQEIFELCKAKAAEEAGEVKQGSPWRKGILAPKLQRVSSLSP